MIALKCKENVSLAGACRAAIVARRWRQWRRCAAVMTKKSTWRIVHIITHFPFSAQGLFFLSGAWISGSVFSFSSTNSLILRTEKKKWIQIEYLCHKVKFSNYTRWNIILISRLIVERAFICSLSWYIFYIKGFGSLYTKSQKWIYKKTTF